MSALCLCVLPLWAGVRCAKPAIYYSFLVTEVAHETQNVSRTTTRRRSMVLFFCFFLDFPTKSQADAVVHFPRWYPPLSRAPYLSLSLSLSFSFSFSDVSVVVYRSPLIPAQSKNISISRSALQLCFFVFRFLCACARRTNPTPVYAKKLTTRNAFCGARLAAVARNAGRGAVML